MDFKNVGIAIHCAARHGTLVDSNRLFNLAYAAWRVRHISGAMAELGVYRGGSASVLCSCLPAVRLWLFDTFAGMPADDADNRGKHKRGEFAADLAMVKQFLIDTNTVFCPGEFPDSLTAVPRESGLADELFRLVHLDADIYQSTIAGLRYFWPRITVGGVLVMDDFGRDSTPGVMSAVKAFFGTELLDRVLQACSRDVQPCTAFALHQLVLYKDQTGDRAVTDLL